MDNPLASSDNWDAVADGYAVAPEYPVRPGNTRVSAIGAVTAHVLLDDPIREDRRRVQVVSVPYWIVSWCVHETLEVRQ